MVVVVAPPLIALQLSLEVRATTTAAAAATTTTAATTTATAAATTTATAATTLLLLLLLLLPLPAQVSLDVRATTSGVVAAVCVEVC